MAVRTKHFAFINLTLQLVNVRHVINEIANLPVLIAAISMMKLKASRIVFTTPNTSNGGLILSVPCLNLLSSYVPLCDLRQFMAIFVKQIVAVLLVQKPV